MYKNILEALIEEYYPGTSIEQVPVFQMESILNSNTNLTPEKKVGLMKDFLNQGIDFYTHQIIEKIKSHQEITQTQYIPDFDRYNEMRAYRPIINKIIDLHYKRDGIGKPVSPREVYKSIIKQLSQEN